MEDVGDIRKCARCRVQAQAGAALAQLRGLGLYQRQAIDIPTRAMEPLQATRHQLRLHWEQAHQDVLAFGELGPVVFSHCA